MGFWSLTLNFELLVSCAEFSKLSSLWVLLWWEREGCGQHFFFLPLNISTCNNHWASLDRAWFRILSCDVGLVNRILRLCLLLSVVKSSRDTQSSSPNTSPCNGTHWGKSSEDTSSACEELWVGLFLICAKYPHSQAPLLLLIRYWYPPSVLSCWPVIFSNWQHYFILQNQHLSCFLEFS